MNELIAYMIIIYPLSILVAAVVLLLFAVIEEIHTRIKRRKKTNIRIGTVVEHNGKKVIRINLSNEDLWKP